MGKMVNIHEAKTNFSRLIQSIRDGSESEVVIALGGKPVARLVPYAQQPRQLGLDEGLVFIDDDFDADDEEIAALFYGDGTVEP
jgi:antitoxin (DNA-binding transcriptional repressor) of toxin-antitoxin stability system